MVIGVQDGDADFRIGLQGTGAKAGAARQGQRRTQKEGTVSVLHVAYRVGAFRIRFISNSVTGAA